MAMLRPAQLAESNKEDGHQMALFAEIAIRIKEKRLPAFMRFAYAVPNGGLRGDTRETALRRGAKLKATGVKAGVPDICVPIPQLSYHGLYIELKRPKTDSNRQGRESKEQEEYKEFLISAGYKVEVCVGWEAAIEAIDNYLGRPSRFKGTSYGIWEPGL